jgi:hypothetical protein
MPPAAALTVVRIIRPAIAAISAVGVSVGGDDRIGRCRIGGPLPAPLLKPISPSGEGCFTNSTSEYRSLKSVAIRVESG